MSRPMCPDRQCLDSPFSYQYKAAMSPLIIRLLYRHAVLTVNANVTQWLLPPYRRATTV